MKKALLIIGDSKINRRKSAPSFNSFVRHIERLNKKRKVLTGGAVSKEIHIIKYRDVLSNNLPEILAPVLHIALFFPYEYWNKNIEVYKKDSRAYGDKKFGREYKKFFDKIDKILKEKYQDKEVQYINPPKSSILERDKKESKKLFKKKNIPTPKSFTVKKLKDIHRLIARGVSLYIKPRFGAFGKGITYLSKDLMITNFLFRKGKIKSRTYDYNWRFSKINGRDRNRLLKMLLSMGCICEEAIEPPIFNGRRFDFRVYCIYGRIVYYYVRSTLDTAPVTNWSQGGRIEKKSEFSEYVFKNKIKRVKSLARQVAKELSLNYTGVDIILSKNSSKAYVLEAHSFPGYEKGFDLMGCLARKILKQ